MIEISYVVNKEYLRKKNGSFESRALSDTVSIHETLETALQAIRNDSTSVLSFHELNEQFDDNVTVLTVSMEEYRDGELHDMEGFDVYGVIEQWKTQVTNTEIFGVLKCGVGLKA